MVTPCKVLVTPRPPVASLDYVLRQLVPGSLYSRSELADLAVKQGSLVTIIPLFL